MSVETIWTNARLLTFAGEGLGVVEDGAVACAGGRILFAGAMEEAPRARRVVDCEGRWITPGLIDCHTHLVFAGDRAGEFEQRLTGVSYAEIARAGGGIVSTVRATRAASEAELVASALSRLDRLMAEGVTTVEVKSGYGLALETERRMLAAARALGRARDVSVVTSYLGAHAVSPEFDGDADGYIDRVCADVPVLAAAGLVDAVDAFCDIIGFTPAQTVRVFEAARAAGLKVKLHADQLADLGGAALAASFGALSADHLEHMSEVGAGALAAAGTVAVLLPGAFYTLRETHKPPVAALRAAGARMAVSTDCNPGSSPLTSLLLAMNMGATLFGLTVDECLAGVTREAARALGRLGEVGTLEVGKLGDLAIWEVERPAELVYRMGFNPLWARVWRGCSSALTPALSRRERENKAGGLG